MWGKISRHRTGLVGAVLIMIFIVTALVSPWVAPFDPVKMDLSKARMGPNKDHWLGTDELGRDILSRIIVGARLSLVISIGAVGLALVLGCTWGALAAYYGGRADLIMMRWIDIMMAFPGILLAIVIITITGPGIMGVVVAVGISYIPVFARLIRGSVLAVKNEDFVRASVAMGSSHIRILFIHILPNVFAPVLVQFTLNLGTAIIMAAALSFLGLGAQPPTPEWGAMLSTGRTFLHSDPHICVFPGLAIMLVVIGFNVFGDSLRDILDPRLRGSLN
jgi:ABC-type dipeptide/oligopeptide/nickel transport system permease subunit